MFKVIGIAVLCVTVTLVSNLHGSCEGTRVGGALVIGVG